MEYLVFDDTKYPIRIYYEKRRNARVSIGKKAVHIRIPSHLGRREKSVHIEEFKRWALERLQENPERFKARTPRQYTDGEVIAIGDREYTLKIRYREKKSSSARLTEYRLELSISSTLSEEEKSRHISELISKCIGRERLPALVKRVNELNGKYFKLKTGNIRFRYNKSNWGSCTKRGNISISTRLLFAPDDILEYVCIHELAHLVEMNHSKRFWSIVEKAVPDHKKKRRWLRENRDRCWF